ncbi:MAG TPA: hypothetical protein DCR63_02625 [Microbacterium sp.]|nr:hypothetical protein [Microbacterium sp.]
MQQWRVSLGRARVIGAGRSLYELEEHLRDQAEDLTQSGSSEDEAFLIALKRLDAAGRCPPSSRGSTTFAGGSTSSSLRLGVVRRARGAAPFRIR